MKSQQTWWTPTCVSPPLYINTFNYNYNEILFNYFYLLCICIFLNNNNFFKSIYDCPECKNVLSLVIVSLVVKSQYHLQMD